MKFEGLERVVEGVSRQRGKNAAVCIFCFDGGGGGGGDKRGK